MRINKVLFSKEIFGDQFGSNYSKCAKAMGVKTPQLHRFISKEQSQAGAKLIGCLYRYCKCNGIDFERYIFLN